MGLEWALVDDKQKRIFELGKGSWGTDLLPSKAPNTREPDYEYWMAGGEEGMAVRAMEVWRDWNDWCPEPPDQSDYEWIADVGRRIYDFCQEAGWANLRLVNDADDSWFDCNQNGYVQVGSRYTSR